MLGLRGCKWIEWNNEFMAANYCAIEKKFPSSYKHDHVHKQTNKKSCA